MSASVFSRAGLSNCIVLPDDLTGEATAEWRAHLLDCRRNGIPTAARLQPNIFASEETLFLVCEFLQYVELCITDSDTAARLVFPNSTVPVQPAAVCDKLLSRFGFGGVVLTDCSYARLNTPAAEALYAVLQPIAAKIKFIPR
ncbi:MAG: hypothetical protein IKL84_08050 [Clostridia bacterium]|nr:hypothetical protein [Clostridia bacterium]